MAKPMTGTSIESRRIGRVVRLLRKQAGVHQSEIAALVGVDRSVYGKMEAGRVEWKPGAIAAACGRFGIGIDDLYSAADIHTVSRPVPHLDTGEAARVAS